MTGRADWDRACRALNLLAIDPAGLGGMTIRARAGPVRDTFTRALDRLPAPLVRLHPDVSDDALFGGVDLSRTLEEGRLVETSGSLAGAGAAVLTMAERASAELAARLAGFLDCCGGPLVLLDEGAEPEEHAPAPLADRLAFSVDLGGIGRLEATPPDPPDIAAAQAVFGEVMLDHSARQTLVALAARLGIASLRGPLLAARAARAHAALSGRQMVAEADLRAAAELVLAPRATQLPVEEEPAPPQPEKEDPQEREADGDAHSQSDLPTQMLIDAVRAALPDGPLPGAAMALGRSKGRGAGARKKGNARGRPLPSRPGRIGGQARVDLVATLRAAAPWQTIRRRQADHGRPVMVAPGDIRVRRYEDRSDRLLVFAVDASGSAAMARLAEAKGAVELLLARAYETRDHVALIAFRGQEAEVILPPTRSLVRTKRALAGLPGGGGTPLAAGLAAAARIGAQARGQGMSPTLVLLTDGRGNIGLDGRADRQQAQQDAEALAAHIRGDAMPGLVLDTAMRPQSALADLAALMGARYVPLPRADAARLSGAVAAHLPD